jgi:hypothetical protein
MTRRSHLLVCVAFLLAIFVPFTAVVTGQTNPRTIENRPLTAFPRLTGRALLHADTYSQLGAYIVDRIPWRDRAIAERERLSVALFTESAGDQVVVGDDGWLYLAENVRRACYTADEIHQVESDLAELSDLFARSGRQWRLLVPPQKETVYPGHLQARDRRDSCIAANSAALQAATRGTNPGYSTVLSATRTDPGLYFPRDTHWNDRGAIIGAQDLVDSLLPGLFDDGAYTFSKEAISTGVGTDLLRSQGVSGTARVERAVARRPGVEVTLTDVARSTPGVPVIHEQRSGGPLVPGRVLVLHDSFGRALAPLASPWFADVTWFTVNHGQTGGALGDAIGEADTVVLVLTERHLVELLGELVDVVRAASAPAGGGHGAD